MKAREPITPDRLFEASMAVLNAVGDTAPRRFPPELMAAPCLTPFTQFEVEEAAAFLVRMGMLEPRTPKAA